MSALVTLLSIAIATPALAAPEAGAVRLGDVDLRDAKDWDMIRLGACDGSGNVPVTHLGVRVTKFPATINKLKVTFHNGGEQELDVRHQFRPGGESRWIDLRGPARCIQTIRIVGDSDTVGWRPGRQAQVAFWGKSAGAAAPMPEPIAAPVAEPAGAVRLGDVDLRDAKDWDMLAFGPCKASGNIPVRSLGVRVTKHPAQIDSLKVVFWNGQSQELAVRHHFMPGAESRRIDLAGDARCIKSIRIVGDTDSLGWRPGKQAQVAFWGKP